MRKKLIYVRMAPRVTIEQRQQIVVLRASGCSIKEIGKRTGITRATINLWLRRNEETGGDLKARQRQNYKRKTTAEQDTAILVAHYNRPLLSTRDTATEHKVSTQTIRRRLKAVGLKTKKAKKKEVPEEPAHAPAHVHPHQPLPLVPFQADFASANFVPGLPYPASYPPPADGYNAIKPHAPPPKAPPKKPPAKKAPPKRPPAKKPVQSSFSNMLCVANDVDPSEVRLEEMLKGPERDRWKHAMMSELQSYADRDVWEPVPRDSDRYRARLLLLRVALKSLA